MPVNCKTVMKKLLFLILIIQICISTTSLFSQENAKNVRKDTVYLWPEDSPNNVATPLTERPLMEVWLPREKTIEKIPCILVCPGGGYNGVSYPLEGKPYAEFFTKNGYACAVLIYRVYPNHFPAPYADACRAMRLLKHDADKFGIDSSRIALLGSSAGGHLVTTVSTRPGLFIDPDDDLAGTNSARPKCQIALYPVISFVNHEHKGSVLKLLGENPDENKKILLSNELHVTKNTPPVFLYHNDKDATVPVENSLMYAAACAEKNVTFSLHVYSYDIHAAGLAFDIPELKDWPNSLLVWLKRYL